MSSDTRSNATMKLYLPVIVATTLIIPSVLAVQLVLNFRHQYFLTHVEGVWLTCAHDFVHGVFYRPLLSSLGYGGTRYFPLYFVLTAVTSKIFGTLETSALILSAVSVILLCVGAWIWLRGAGVSRLLCVAGVAAILAASTTQQALVGAKGDALAAVLNLFGLLLCLRFDAGDQAHRNAGRASIYGAALLFTLAFAAKLTTIFGVAAVFLTWIFARRFKDAMHLAIATATGFVAVLVTMYFASGGRVFSIFRSCALGGGSLSYTLLAPLHLLSKALEVDPIFLLFVIPAAAFGVAAFRHQLTSILPVYFVITLLVTIVIFGSPGIGINHLLDLHVAAIILLVISFTNPPQKHQPEFSATGAGVLAFCLLVACGPTLQSLHGDLQRRSIHDDALEIMTHIADDGRPVLAENAEVVLAAGKTPYLLDPFMLRILCASQPTLTSAFREKMRNHGFSAVVLQEDPHSAEGKVWYTRTHFGGEFLTDLEANYSLDRRVGEMWVFTPR